AERSEEVGIDLLDGKITFSFAGRGIPIGIADQEGAGGAQAAGVKELRQVTLDARRAFMHVLEEEDRVIEIRLVRRADGGRDERERTANTAAGGAAPDERPRP